MRFDSVGPTWSNATATKVLTPGCGDDGFVNVPGVEEGEVVADSGAYRGDVTDSVTERDV